MFILKFDDSSTDGMYWCDGMFICKTNRGSGIRRKDFLERSEVCGIIDHMGKGSRVKNHDRSLVSGVSDRVRSIY